MRRAVTAVLGGCVVLLVCMQGRFYTYDVRQRLHDDSVRVVDSVRAADSARRADSLMILRYESSDETRSEQRREESRQADAADSARKAFVPIAGSEVDVFSPRSITIPGDDEHAAAIDSIQNVIDGIGARLYGNDPHFKKMERFAFDEKKRFLRYLIENRLADTAGVVSWCERMHAMLDLERVKILLILKTPQNENTKTFLMSHLKKTQDNLGRWSALLVSLASSREKTEWKPAPGR